MGVNRRAKAPSDADLLRWRAEEKAGGFTGQNVPTNSCSVLPGRHEMQERMSKERFRMRAAVPRAVHHFFGGESTGLSVWTAVAEVTRGNRCSTSRGSILQRSTSSCRPSAADVCRTAINASIAIIRRSLWTPAVLRQTNPVADSPIRV